MSVAVEASPSDKKVTITIVGQFGFSDHREFREAYRNNRIDDAQYIVDLHGTEYIDSSGLGMLLLLREHVGGEHADVSLVNCRPDVKQVLEIANFQKLFRLT
jgi:HptB-dependent secretion and biofilm anti anti-sigma factor